MLISFSNNNTSILNIDAKNLFCLNGRFVRCGERVSDSNRGENQETVWNVNLTGEHKNEELQDFYLKKGKYSTRNAPTGASTAKKSNQITPRNPRIINEMK